MHGAPLSTQPRRTTNGRVHGFDYDSRFMKKTLQYHALFRRWCFSFLGRNKTTEQQQEQHKPSREEGLSNATRWHARPLSKFWPGLRATNKPLCLCLPSNCCGTKLLFQPASVWLLTADPGCSSFTTQVFLRICAHTCWCDWSHSSGQLTPWQQVVIQSRHSL